jgi:hypothetical protein
MNGQAYSEIMVNESDAFVLHVRRALHENAVATNMVTDTYFAHDADTMQRRWHDSIAKVCV